VPIRDTIASPPVKSGTSILRRAEIFRDLEDDELAALQACVVVREIPPGTVVFREGDPGAAMLIVAEGTLSAHVRRKDGGEQEINRMGPGEAVGEMSFIDPAPRSATVRALTAAVVYELSEDGMRALRRQAPGAAAGVVGAVILDVTRRLRRIDQMIERELREREGVSADAR
jgi:CRP-like cAMP-binding protein